MAAPELDGGLPPPPPRQRWRLTLARSADAPRLAGRELADAWEGTLEASGLPVHRPLGRARARVAFGAPLSMGIAAECELADIVLTEVCPAWRVREAVAGRCPEGWRLVDLYDVWLGGPPLAGQVVAADYRIEIGGSDPAAVADAAAALMRAPAIRRERAKGNGVVVYDLRPLLLRVGMGQAGPPLVVQARTRFHPALGTGRPEEVVAALGDLLGTPLTTGAVVRERLVVSDEQD